MCGSDPELGTGVLVLGAVMQAPLEHTRRAEGVIAKRLQRRPDDVVAAAEQFD
jgi:hypothetical protein